jgi:mono/diheme cytochrome c family protein
LRFPYNSQAALAVWRAFFFAPRVYEPEPARSAEWNRGAYLVRGLGHCSACHAQRNAFGATSEKLELSGGLIPGENWYAPSLGAAGEAGVAHWRDEQVVALLKDGVTSGASVLGPMADVVYRSTQHLSAEDLRAITIFLKALPSPEVRAERRDAALNAAQIERGLGIYKQHCAQCHGDAGEGMRGMFSALAGNRAVTMRQSTNVIRVLLSGGYLPATAGNPRPFGMPPFGHVLSDAEIADVATAIRQSFGNDAPPVSALDVLRGRRGGG